ncbi:hypothetical protein NKI41_31245 [Mesorhizobium sp. M0601]|uniref:hypothetical protein n=1 Tax=Mesorhizobium sp. M0601 TaxID=2956969 RepID=UPI00333C1235
MNADAIREEIASANVEAVIQAKSNRRDPIPHDKAKYKWRNQIERLFNKLKNWRRIATRYDKTKGSYLGFLPIAAVKLYTLCPRALAGCCRSSAAHYPSVGWLPFAALSGM